MDEKETMWQRIREFFCPDEEKERIKKIKGAYSIEMKDGELYVVYDKTIVIRKLDGIESNAKNLDIITDAIDDQLVYEGYLPVNKKMEAMLCKKQG